MFKLMIIFGKGSVLILVLSLLDYTGRSCVGHFEAFSVFPVKAIALQSIKSNRGLNEVFKVYKAVEVFSAHFRDFGD